MKGKMFSDEQFTAALKELGDPRLDDYDFFVECSNLKIYRKYDEVSCLYEYKVMGCIDCDTETCYKVYMDLDYRKHWDSYVKELYEDTSDGMEFIYWNVNLPFPMRNRDYTYVREARHIDDLDDLTWVILAQAHPAECVSEKSKVIRVKEYKQFLIIQKVGDEKTKVFMHYFDNPGGSIPTWLINWAAKKGVPSFLTDLQKACSGYENYIRDKK